MKPVRQNYSLLNPRRRNGSPQPSFGYVPSAGSGVKRAQLVFGLPRCRCLGHLDPDSREHGAAHFVCATRRSRRRFLRAKVKERNHSSTKKRVCQQQLPCGKPMPVPLPPTPYPRLPLTHCTLDRCHDFLHRQLGCIDHKVKLRRIERVADTVNRHETLAVILQAGR